MLSVERRHIPTISGDRRRLFLEALAQVGSIAAACKVAGIERPADIRRLRKDNRYFDDQCQKACEQAVARLEVEAFRRAIDGDESYVVSQGRVVRYQGRPLIEKKRSDQLLALLLKAHGGDKYNAKTDVNAQVKVSAADAKSRLHSKLISEIAQAEEAAGIGGDE
jgi:hypothetical protein